MFASELFDLSGEVALVTGASSGLGNRFARVLAANGATAIVAARRVERLETLVSEIEQAGGRAYAVACDVTDRDQIRRAFDHAQDKAGPVTVLVNNAGIAHAGGALNLKETEWRSVMATNLDAVFAVAQEAAQRMVVAERPGSIINIASVLGTHLQKGVAAYAVSKAGVAQLTKALALEWARYGIRVNAIAPGWFRTEINDAFLDSEMGDVMKRKNPMRRFGAVGDLDGVLLLLASKAGAYMTGDLITVDGGHTLEV
jgi:3-oxoacyl-[acyl-carrier protein] reductase